ncbi:hypothetical protein GCM10010329_65380 [Streptomyces spiroverticillatus]|uniref:Secreted protein n=1 Tax=Streptomyces finlayi TaxID=67296 RepID=A0A919CDG8_9ACTN|nr:hypothetical protein [Streptomyces finlayi]GHA32911.1 hypothetical protein GCM10010329_65380 [Streptomyces spiroverticillatus]GHD10252.1 hypothetical protein GCM10010334_65170 [Streptomyces finlayi]
MKHPYAHKAAAAALGLTLLTGTATACAPTGEGAGAAPHPVYSARPADQLVAARKATQAAGSARFTSTLTWQHPRTSRNLTDRTTGDQSFTHGVAHANRTVTVPDDFPETIADLYGDRPGRKRYGYAVQGSDVFYRTLTGTWLRYPSGAPQEFAQATWGFNDRAGSLTPYGGTLADVAFASFPTAPPKTLPVGTRRYTLNADGGVAESLLPKGLALRDSPEPAVAKSAPVQVPLTVDLDQDGRLTRATADLTPLLADRETDEDDGAEDNLSLRAELNFTHYGTRTGPPVPPGDRTEDATRTLTLLTGLKPGACATTDTGLDGLSLVRPADCAAGRHDLRVLGQVKVKKSTRAPITTQDGDDIAVRRCATLAANAAPRLRAEAHPPGNYAAYGQSQWSTLMGGSDGGTNTVEGQYTCYFLTSVPVDPDSVQEV